MEKPAPNLCYYCLNNLTLSGESDRNTSEDQVQGAHILTGFLTNGVLLPRQPPQTRGGMVAPKQGHSPPGC